MSFRYFIAIVTVKLPKDPRPPLIYSCPLGENNYCSDITGSPHSFIMFGETEEKIREAAEKKYGHVTRIEFIDYLELRKLKGVLTHGES